MKKRNLFSGKKNFSFFKPVIILSLLVSGAFLSLNAQVTIGDDKLPEDFSVLELISNGTQGLRLPQMTTVQRNAVTNADFKLNPLAKGLQIFNTTSDCTEYWNGSRWVSLCKGQASITFSPTAPNEPVFPPGGEDRGPFTPSDDPACTTENPAFTFTVMTGSDFLYINVINEATGEFHVSMSENPTAVSRNAILRITNNCTQEYKEFVFSQAGDNTGCGASDAVPAISNVNGTSLCGTGAVYLYLAGTPTGTFIWTLNGAEVGRGTSYVATQGGTYIVYGDKIGCPNSQSIIVTSAGSSAPSPVQLLVGKNNGYVCSLSEETMLFAGTAGSGTIVWYKDGMKQADKTGVAITAGIGTWFAVVESGGCSSVPSNNVVVSLHPDSDGGSNVLPITFNVNGQTPTSNNITLCSGGSLLLEVAFPEVDVTYTWYAGDSKTGTTLGTGAILSTTVSAVQAYPILQCVGEKSNACAQAQYTQFSISGVTAPVQPTISSNTSSVLCGAATQLTATTITPGVSYIWKKDDTVIIGQTSNTLAVSACGVYTVYAKSGDCVSIESAPFNVSIPLGFSGDLAITGNATPKVNATETYKATMTNDEVGATYIWTVPAPHIIKNGQGTPFLTVQFGPVDDTFNLEVSASNACGSATPNPATRSITTSSPCDISIVNHVPTGKSISVEASINPTLSIVANSTSAITYQWYSNTTATNSGGTPIPDQTSAALTDQTSLTTSGSPYYFYCVATADCDSHPAATSDCFTVTVTTNVALLPTGSGKLVGRTCFDIAASPCDGTAVTSTRTANKTDFSKRTLQTSSSAATYTGVQRYVFTATTSDVNYVRYNLKVTGGSLTAAELIDPATPLSGTLLPGALSSGSSVNLDINYKSDLNTNANLIGKDRTNGSKILLTFYYNNGMDDVKVETTIGIQDCSCCGAYVTSSVFKVFMCHNLGADESKDPFTASKDLHGHFYKWGVATPAIYAHENTSLAFDSYSDTNASTGWPSLGGTPPSSTVDWNMLTANPCPAGYRVPTKAEWDGVITLTAQNPRTNTTGSWTAGIGNWTSGTKFGNALFLPAAGHRATINGLLGSRGSNGNYWSSTVNDTSAAYRMSFAVGGQNTLAEHKSDGFSVRCVAE